MHFLSFPGNKKAESNHFSRTGVGIFPRWDDVFQGKGVGEAENAVARWPSLTPANHAHAQHDPQPQPRWPDLRCSHRMRLYITLSCTWPYGGAAAMWSWELFHAFTLQSPEGCAKLTPRPASTRQRPGTSTPFRSRLYRPSWEKEYPLSEQRRTVTPVSHPAAIWDDEEVDVRRIKE